MAFKMEKAMKTMSRLCDFFSFCFLFLSHTHKSLPLSLDGHQDGGGHEDHAEAGRWILGKFEILQGTKPISQIKLVYLLDLSLLSIV